ncbi:MAG: alpha/beta hydrolase-fold protein [Caulobacter sp.]|nr:alpha/beta hydrolase-fold protein [Caulobacter sp.]
MNRRRYLLTLGASLAGLAAGGTAQGRSTARPGGTAPAPPLQWVTAAVKGPGLSFHTFQSRAAATEVSFHIYTPPAYAADPTRRFPVVYWLHGSGGGVSGIARLSALFDEAIAAGRAPPFLVVFVNGLRMGMYVDWANGRAPLETVIVHELRPHIDANWRTIATREGRLLDGFSMGGYGAARFGFLYPELFRNVSVMGAGPMQETLDRTPRASRVQAEDLLRDVYGGDQDRFRAVSPRRYAEQNAATLARGSRLRLVIGDQDETLQNNRDFHAHLTRLGIPHDWIVLPGVGHDPIGVLTALGDRHWAFYRAAFAPAGG